jgi:Tfp pilus assembly protein FimT
MEVLRPNLCDEKTARCAASCRYKKDMACMTKKNSSTRARTCTNGKAEVAAERHKAEIT